MQNNISPFQQFTAPNMSQLAALQTPTGGTNSYAPAQIQTQRVNTDSFTPNIQAQTAPAQNIQNPGGEAENKKSKYLKYAKKYVLPAIAVIGAAALIAWFALHGRTKTPPAQPKIKPKNVPPKAPKPENVPPAPKPENDWWAKQAAKREEELKLHGFVLDNSSETKIYFDDIDAQFPRPETVDTTPFDPVSELKKWVEKLKADDKHFVEKSGEKSVNVPFEGFKISPYTIADDTDIGLMVKSSGGTLTDFHDWEFFGCLAGNHKLNSTDKGPAAYRKRMKIWGDKYIFPEIRETSDSGLAANYRIGKRLYATSDSAGRKIVFFELPCFATPDLNDRDQAAQMILRSPGEDFSDLQKCVIRIFNDAENKKYANDVMRTMVDYADPSGRAIYNKTALLSAIQSWAEQSQKVDADELFRNAGGFLKLNLC